MFCFPPQGLCVSWGFIICLQYFRGFNLLPFDYYQLIKQRGCQAGDREMEQWGGISPCLEARAFFLSSALLVTICRNSLSMLYLSIITVLVWILVSTVKYSLSSDLSTEPSCFSSWLNRPSFYFALPSLLDCRRPARGRRAGFQGSAAGNKELLTSASKSHIGEKEKIAVKKNIL